MYGGIGGGIAGRLLRVISHKIRKITITMTAIPPTQRRMPAAIIPEKTSVDGVPPDRTRATWTVIVPVGTAPEKSTLSIMTVYEPPDIALKTPPNWDLLR